MLLYHRWSYRNVTGRVPGFGLDCIQKSQLSSTFNLPTPLTFADLDLGHFHFLLFSNVSLCSALSQPGLSVSFLIVTRLLPLLVLTM